MASGGPHPRMVSAREIVGKRITAFHPRAQAVKGRTMHQPRVELDDGSFLYFVTEEHPEGNWYGTFIGRVPPEQQS